MSQELVMIFNGDGDKVSTDPPQEVCTENMISALYNEIQQAEMIQADAADKVIEVNQEEFTLKEVDCSAVDTSSLATATSVAETPVVTESLQFIDEINTSVAADTVPTDQNNLRVKTVEIPDSWKIAILESNGMFPRTAEPLVENEKQVYQLWECPTCTALFREKELCEQHLKKSHDFSCGLCNEPFQEKEALENHVIRHISEIPGHAVQKISFDEPLKKVKDEFSKNLGSSEGQREFNISVAQSSSNKFFNCGNCSKIFSSVLELEKHMECHCNGGADEKESDEDVEMLSTKLSDARQASPRTGITYSKQDSVTKQSSKKLTCDMCSKTFFTKNSLLLHMSKNHSVELSENYVCDECGKSFKWKLSLQNHQVVQHGKRRRTLV